ncbi:hypothetical protein [Actinocrispum sp. NPDC049592]|uniref:hypothetical protein n=1 Tax=Actinocrispum sp. NPDC049592 TaxID=3154835 RepID=UPI00344A7F1E
MTGSSPARDAGTRVRRLVLRLLMLAGLTAAGWLTGMVLAGTASADTGPHITINLPGLGNGKPTQDSREQDSREQDSREQDSREQGSREQKISRTPQGPGLGLGGVVNGLLGAVNSTVNTTVKTVNTTVKTTVQTVTSTLSTVTATVNHTVGSVVHCVSEIPQKVVTPVVKQTLPSVAPVVEETVDDILEPTPTHSGSATSETPATTARTEAAPGAPAAPAVAPEAAQQPAVVEHPHAQTPHRTALQTVTNPATVVERLTPADDGPGPLPVPSAPSAPATPAPSVSSGNDGGHSARGVLAVFAPQYRLAPPPLLGRLERGDPVAARGRTAGLPVTTPD